MFPAISTAQPRFSAKSNNNKKKSEPQAPFTAAELQKKTSDHKKASFWGKLLAGVALLSGTTFGLSVHNAVTATPSENYHSRTVSEQGDTVTVWEKGKTGDNKDLPLTIANGLHAAGAAGLAGSYRYSRRKIERQLNEQGYYIIAGGQVFKVPDSDPSKPES